MKAIILLLIALGCGEIKQQTEDKPIQTVGESPVNKNLNPENIGMLTYDQLSKIEEQNPLAYYLPDRVITPISLSVVRKNIKKPEYQEAESYSFLMKSPKFPHLERMDDGTIVLFVSALIKNERVGLMLKSKDEGKSWTTPVQTPFHRAGPVNLGNGKLMALHPGGYYLSNDGFETFSAFKKFPTLPDGRWLGTDAAYTRPLVEGNIMTFILCAPINDQIDWEKGKLFTQAVLMRYLINEDKLEVQKMFEPELALNEGSITRASNGNLVAAFRTQLLGMVIPNDNWMGLATSFSTDNGHTWSLPVQQFSMGVVHYNFQTLPDKSLLMTYAARISQLDGHPHHGIEAVRSTDNGITWDWNGRYIIARIENSSPHTPDSLLLKDGKVLTVYMKDLIQPWTTTGKSIDPSETVGQVSVVIWKP